MKRLFSVYNQYYATKGKTAMDFLNDAVGYLKARNDSLNEGKTIFALLLDWCKRVEFEKHTRF